MNKYLLQSFCSKSASSPFQELFIIDDFICATDGQIAIRIPRQYDWHYAHIVGSIITLQWEPSIEGEWVDLPPYKLPNKEVCYACQGVGKINICPECDGDGYVELDSEFNSYECDCKYCDCEGIIPGDGDICGRCDGDGDMYPVDYSRIEFDGHGLNALLLEKIKDLPGVKLFSRRDEKQHFYFRFDGGHGIIMGMRG